MRGPHLDGGFSSDVGDEEVHGDVLTVDVFVHHISDGLGHHVRIQVGIILSGRNRITYFVRGHSSLAFSKNMLGRKGVVVGGGVWQSLRSAIGI